MAAEMAAVRRLTVSACALQALQIGRDALHQLVDVRLSIQLEIHSSSEPGCPFE